MPPQELFKAIYGRPPGNQEELNAFLLVWEVVRQQLGIQQQFPTKDEWKRMQKAGVIEAQINPALDAVTDEDVAAFQVERAEASKHKAELDAYKEEGKLPPSESRWRDFLQLAASRGIVPPQNDSEAWKYLKQSFDRFEDRWRQTDLATTTFSDFASQELWPGRDAFYDGLGESLVGDKRLENSLRDMLDAAEIELSAGDFNRMRDELKTDYEMVRRRSGEDVSLTDYLDIAIGPIIQQLQATAEAEEAALAQKKRLAEPFGNALDRVLGESGTALPPEIQRALQSRLEATYNIAQATYGGQLAPVDFLRVAMGDALAQVEEEGRVVGLQAMAEQLQKAGEPEKAARLIEATIPVPEAPQPTGPPEVAQAQRRLNEIRQQLTEGGLGPEQEDSLTAEQLDLQETMAAAGTPEQARQSAQTASALAGVPTPKGPFLAPDIDFPAAFGASLKQITDKGFAGYVSGQQDTLKTGFETTRRRANAALLAGEIAPGEEEEPSGAVRLSEKTTKLRTAPSFSEYLSEQLPTLFGAYGA